MKTRTFRKSAVGQLVCGRRASVVAVLLALSAAGCSTYEAARLYQQGTQALDRGDSAQAIARLERASALQPSASEIHNHLGLAHLASGDQAAAELAFERAVELDCDNDAALANLRALRAGTAEPGAVAPTHPSARQGSP